MPNKRKPLSQITPTHGEPSQKRKKTDNSTDQSQNSQQKPLKAGSILYMSLKNFMCHSWLEVKFERNVTVVTGNNGSGKSAILTALVVGLGGKAGLTNRGTSIKTFVKAGMTSGSVEIHLNNDGMYAYKKDVFGSKIIVVRNLSASGSGGYKIKNYLGEVISTKLMDLKNITTALEIQVDNPVCILNQDVSRSFLSSNDPKNKFTLFFKATRLDKLTEQYEKLTVDANDSFRVFKEKQREFRKLEDEYKKLERLLKGQDLIRNLKAKKLNLQAELHWARIRDLELEMEEKRGQLEKIQEEMSKLLENHNKKKDSAQEIREKIRVLESEVKEVSDAVNAQKLPQNDAKRAIEDLMNLMRDKRNAKTQINAEIESKIQDADYLKREIANANESLSKVEQEKIERINQLRQNEDKLRKHENHLETARETLFQISSDLSNKENEQVTLIRILQDLDHKINAEKTNLYGLERETSGNPLLLYNRDMPKIKEAIKKNLGKFQKEPLGPIGHYIKLVHKEWAVAVEGHLTPGLMGAFIVDNQKDNRILREIYQKVSPNSPLPLIITTKFIFKKHDVSRFLVQPPDDCLRMIDAINVENPVVFNCLVDQSTIEQILLIPSDNRAQELLSHQARVPRNCMLGLTIKGDKYFPDPNYKTYGSNYHTAKYLQGNTQKLIDQLKQNVEKLIMERHEEQNRLNAFKQQMNNQMTQKRELENKIRKINEAKNAVRQAINTLKSTAEPEVASVNVLQSELLEIEKILKSKKEGLTSINDEITTIKAQIKDKENHLDRLKESTKHLDDRLEPLNSKIAEHRRLLRDMSTKDQFFEQKIQEVKRSEDGVKSELKVFEIKIAKRSEEAQAIGERLPNLRDVQDISAEMTEIDRTVAQIEAESGHYPDIAGRYSTISMVYHRIAPVMEVMKNELSELSRAIDKRNRHYTVTEGFFISYMKYSFRKMLESRQFKGNVEINTQKKTLEMIAIPQEGNQGVTVTTNLSGGERSFTTVAFLYSLWQCTEFPFYFLDEFDVFMDKLNRTKVFQLLINHANSKSDVQHVFLTPQDISFLDPKEVSLLRLQDPERFNQ